MNMKKFLTMAAVAAAMTFGLAACSSDDDADNSVVMAHRPHSTKPAPTGRPLAPTGRIPRRSSSAQPMCTASTHTPTRGRWLPMTWPTCCATRRQWPTLITSSRRPTQASTAITARSTCCSVRASRERLTKLPRWSTTTSAPWPRTSTMPPPL